MSHLHMPFLPTEAEGMNILTERPLGDDYYTYIYIYILCVYIYMYIYIYIYIYHTIIIIIIIITDSLIGYVPRATCYVTPSAISYVLRAYHALCAVCSRYTLHVIYCCILQCTMTHSLTL